MNTEALNLPATGTDLFDLAAEWAIPVGELAPTPASPQAPVAAPSADEAFSLDFPGADTLPPLGFSPRLRRDNELG